MNTRLFDPYLDSMNFLNEICSRFPTAVSFGSGRPKEEFYHVETITNGAREYAVHKYGSEQYFDKLGQYNLTKGIICQEVAYLLEKDEGIIASPEDIIITDGAQEGMQILINTLFASDKDVLLVSDPSYVGFVGYAKIYGTDIRAIRRTKYGIDLNDLEDKLCSLIRESKNPVALYEVPDFHNPTGYCMPVKDRKELLYLAEKYGFYIIEDNPYGYYCFEGERMPTIKSLDKSKNVIYIGSFSKSVFPSIRLGYIITDAIVKTHRTVNLSEECKKTKSFTTVNSSALLQAMLGNLLIREDYSLLNYCREKVAYCKNNRDIIAKYIEENVKYINNWEKPSGGFFCTLEIPFFPTDEIVNTFADKFGVIVCPMKMFYLNQEDAGKELRLSYSYLSPEQIQIGMERLCACIDVLSK